MAKPKHPTTKSIRQGQTIYLVHKYHCPVIQGVFIGRKKTALPPPGEIIRVMPVNIARRKLEELGNDFIYYSIKRATTAARKHCDHRR